MATGGYKITSTVDQGIYEAMQESTAINGSKIGPTYQTPYIDQNTGEAKKQTDMAQNGAVLIENNTGRILGFVAGRDFQVNQVDHAFTTHRSPGSTIKPLLVYAPAMENNIIYPASIIPDTKISILQQNGTYWEPTNYGNKISNNFLTARHSLKNSLNNPTIKIFQTMLSKGINAGEYLKKMGIQGIGEEEYQNIALSIGGTKTGPTVMEQTSAFSTLANGGVHHEAYLIEKIEDIRGKVVYQHEDVSTEVFSPATAYLTTDILRQVAATTDFYNIKGNLKFTSDIAGKTGTSEFEIDNWFVGYTPEVTLGSWIGYDNFYSAHYSITESDGYGHPTMRSLRNWTSLMNAVYSAKPSLFNQSAKFEQPSTVYQDSVVSVTGTKPGTATYNGHTYSIGGSTTTDLFKKDFGPIAPTYHFAVGATNNELDRYWNGLSNQEKEAEKKKAEKEKEVSEDKDKKKSSSSEKPKPSSSTQTTKSSN